MVIGWTLCAACSRDAVDAAGLGLKREPTPLSDSLGQRCVLIYQTPFTSIMIEVQTTACTGLCVLQQSLDQNKEVFTTHGCFLELQVLTFETQGCAYHGMTYTKCKLTRCTNWLQCLSAPNVIQSYNFICWTHGCSYWFYILWCGRYLY